MSWTEQRINSLKALFAEGLSASQIANELGDVTRNGVIGKLHRLGLRSGDNRPRPARPKAPRSARGPSVGGLMARIASKQRHLAKVQDQVTIEADNRTPAVEQSALHVDLFSLTKFVCKFPFGDAAPFTFCGRPKVLGAYCAEHAKLCYVPAPVRRPMKRSGTGAFIFGGKTNARQDATE